MACKRTGCDCRVYAPPSPTRWGSDMWVRHRHSGSVGLVAEVDFDEDLVTVVVGEYDLTWRIENVYEVQRDVR